MQTDCRWRKATDSQNCSQSHHPSASTTASHLSSVSPFCVQTIDMCIFMFKKHFSSQIIVSMFLQKYHLILLVDLVLLCACNTSLLVSDPPSPTPPPCCGSDQRNVSSGLTCWICCNASPPLLNTVATTHLCIYCQNIQQGQAGHSDIPSWQHTFISALSLWWSIVQTFISTAAGSVLIRWWSECILKIHPIIKMLSQLRANTSLKALCLQQ